MKKLCAHSAPYLLVLILSFSAFAQQGQGRGNRDMDPKEFADRQTSRMKESLELTTAQLPKVEKLNLEYAEKMKEARDQAGEDREAMRSKMMEMIKEKDTKLKVILTEEQWTKFAADRKQRMQNRGGGRRRGI